MSYSPFWGWPSDTPASILMEPGLIYSIHGGHPIKASMEDPVNMACQQQRRVNWGLKIHHSDILPCDTQDCLFEVWKWLKWGNVLCLCLYITWSWIHFSISYILPENGRTSFQVLQLKVMITWKNCPGGYRVENVFRTTAYIASPNGGQSYGDNAGIF